VYSIQHYVIKFVSDLWFSAGTSVSSINKTIRHDSWNVFTLVSHLNSSIVLSYQQFTLIMYDMFGVFYQCNYWPLILVWSHEHYDLPTCNKTIRHDSWNVVKGSIKHHNPNATKLSTFFSLLFLWFSFLYLTNMVTWVGHNVRDFTPVLRASNYMFYWLRKPKYPQKTTSHWQTLSHNVVSSTHRLSGYLLIG
jgi:hypothetical protein